MRVGIGYDSHRFADGRRLVLGGVEIKHPQGLAGHSDADAVAHAVTDALLGATGQGDIGRHFPPDHEEWRDAASLDLLHRVNLLVAEQNYQVVNVDVTV
ncbi:MAG TPA: 2-C-methyl-D-erythritol 2,4-cyclodiphosphate synthase, partial [Longimicrobiales bacterium]|nr:2-C-methyl-D-erythritol 2,4-cyclodiphosphate synthase [Longimicrobiales bacterium]